MAHGLRHTHNCHTNGARIGKQRLMTAARGHVSSGEPSCLVVLLVVQLHDLAADHRLQGAVVVRQVGQAHLAGSKLAGQAGPWPSAEAAPPAAAPASVHSLLPPGLLAWEAMPRASWGLARRAAWERSIVKGSKVPRCLGQTLD